MSNNLINNTTYINSSEIIVISDEFINITPIVVAKLAPINSVNKDIEVNAIVINDIENSQVYIYEFPEEDYFLQRYEHSNQKVKTINYIIDFVIYNKQLILICILFLIFILILYFHIILRQLYILNQIKINGIFIHSKIDNLWIYYKLIYQCKGFITYENKYLTNMSDFRLCIFGIIIDIKLSMYNINFNIIVTNFHIRMERQLLNFLYRFIITEFIIDMIPIVGRLILNITDIQQEKFLYNLYYYFLH
jgi:hypothetical protein